MNFLKTFRHVLLISFIAIVAASPAKLIAQPLQTLSDSPEHWHNVYKFGNAEFVDGEVHLISTGNWFFLTKQQYGDFVFEAEVKMPDVSEYSNSGIIFRAQVAQHPEKGAYAYGYQAEVDPSDRKWSGGLYEQGAPRQWLHPIHATRSFPDDDFIKNHSPEWDDKKSGAYKHLAWNRYKVEAVGPVIRIWVNDVLTTHVEDVKFKVGHIGIQHHGSGEFANNGSRKNTVMFRNIRVTSK